VKQREKRRVSENEINKVEKQVNLQRMQSNSKQQAVYLIEDKDK